MRFRICEKWRICSTICLPLFLFFLLFSKSLVFAVETGSDENNFTLSQVVKLAIANDSSVLDARDSLEIARSNLQIAQKEKGFSPSIQLTGDLALMGEVNSSASVVISDSVALNDSTSEAATQVKQSDLDVEKAQNAWEEAQENAKQKAISGFFGTLKAEKTWEMAQRSLDQSQILLQDMEKKYDQEMASSIDLLQAKQSVENSRINLNQAEKNLLFQKQQLNLLMGRNLKIPLSLDNIITYKSLPIELNDLTSNAISNRSDVKDLQWQKEGEILSLKNIQRDQKAKIHLIGAYVEENYDARFDLISPDWTLDWKITGQFSDSKGSSYGNSSNNDPFTPSTTGWGIGLEITWIPFDGGISEEKKKQQEIKITQLERKLNTLPESITLEVLDAYDTFLQSDQAVLITQLEKQIAEESFKIQKQQFEAGLITDRTLKESELALYDAGIKHERAFYDYILSKVQLYRTAGKSIIIDDL